MRRKTIYNWGFYFVMVAILGGACWYATTKEEYEHQPMREPAIEVIESSAVEEKSVSKPYQHISASRRAEAKFILPATGVVSSPFGQRWGRMHEGMDIADEIGTPIVAAFSGRVIYAGWINGYGYSVILEHRQGYTTLYGHMERVLVGQDQSINQGQVIGNMGSTGNSTGSHVHFEVRKNGEIIDPISVLR